MIVPPHNSWLGTLFRIRGSTIVRTWRRLLVAVVIAGVVTALHEGFMKGNELLEIDMTPFSVSGLSLGIFLGFRNNTSYDRFWEGRKLWGRVVNACRSMTRQVLTLARPAGADFHREIVHRLVAYVHVLRLHLRGEDGWEYVRHFLPEDELAQLKLESNPPIAVLQRIGERLRDVYDEGAIHAQHLPVLEASLTELAGVQGGCERIRATPIPFSYNVLMHRIVAVYCFSLPFGLVASTGLLTPFVVLLVAYAFFGLDAVGDEIEDPFGHDDNDLPLAAISTMIEVNIRERIADDYIPKLKKPNADHILN